ncbi:MAG: cell division protease FtsH [Mycobacterium sp.]|jgi:ATP-dependent Zn protease|nr:cell division protease FtsH [Mycobacterium sp.]
MYPPMPEKTTQPWANWEPCEEQRSTQALGQLAEQLPAFFGDSILAGARCSRLSFYDDHVLLELSFVRDHGTERAFVLEGPLDTVWLNGESLAIHEVNDAESLALTEATVLDYLRFFLYFLRADAGGFVLIESPDEVNIDPAAGEHAGDDPAALGLLAARAKAHAPESKGVDSSGRWLFDTVMAYDGGLFTASMAVEPNGSVEMTDDEPVGTVDRLVVPEAAVLQLWAQISESAADPSATAPRAGVDATVDQPRDREITKAVVAVLLEDAIRELNANKGAGSYLLSRFNSETQADKPIEQLTRVVTESKAIVIVESDIPFVEDAVAELIAARASVTRAAAVPGDDLHCQIDVDDRSGMYLLSFHTYRELFDAERVAHELSQSDAPVLVGCNRIGDVPEPLRRMTDVVLTFPAIDPRRFTRIFEQIFHARPTAGWDAASADWTHYLVPGDFNRPRRAGLGPEEALSFLKNRVEDRLRQVTPNFGPRLNDLNGLGEARQVADDLIEDIRAAQAGEIPWSAVDRGLLLVGAPGTGKTSLARAIAQECGVKFVVASAPGWQSSGYLDSHLRAIRADFAEARRYAPAILFIDEIDSVGSRENLSEANAQYQTQVINAVLEEIQGIGSTGWVIVIGATNYVEKVDPALRRAGRLDQVVEIPLPNIDGLERIFSYYLSCFEAEGGQVADVDARALAELAFGLTAADVAFFVRGAARRARRENRPVSQPDLVAEVTRRPRRADSAPRLTPTAMHRVAVHEAGHAVATLLSSTRGEDLTYASISPRLDGSLGFTATIPANTRVLTRASLLEQLETLLAGRGAEEVVFGADDIGAGSGGPGTTSDLAVATRLATVIVCQSGLDEGFLRWTAAPSLEQDARINELLRDTYRNARARLQGNRALLDHIAAALQDKQELSGKEMRRLAESLGKADPPKG